MVCHPEPVRNFVGILIEPTLKLGDPINKFLLGFVAVMVGKDASKNNLNISV